MSNGKTPALKADDFLVIAGSSPVHTVIIKY